MFASRLGIALFVVAAPLMALACNKGSEGGATGAASASATVNAADTEAKQIFDTRCAACHGASGKGDGVAGKALKPTPRDYTDAEWQKTVKDEDIKTVILKGGKAVGKSENMAPNPDLESKPAVVDGLVKIIRGFGKK